MLSGEGNENGEKATIYRCRVISKKATLHVQHTFFNLCHCFARLQRETSQLHVLWRKCRTCSCSLFFTAAHFHLGDRQHFSFSHHCYKISCCSFTKKFLLCFLSLALTLCCSFSGRASLACHPLSLFLCLSLALYSKFADMTINLSLIPQTTRIQKQFPLSIFVFIDSLVVSICFTRHGWLCDFPPK